MIPQYLKKFGKKYGSEVGTTDLETTVRGEPDRYELIDSNDNVVDTVQTILIAEIEAKNRNLTIRDTGKADRKENTVQSFTITPELKRTALYEGMPLFSIAGKKAIGKETDKGITLYSGLDPALLIDSIKKPKGNTRKQNLIFRSSAKEHIRKPKIIMVGLRK